MPGEDERGYHWLEINDFSPGLVTNVRRQSSGVGPVTGEFPGNKLGQASAVSGCITLPGGGLGPLPSLATPIAPPASTVPIAGYNNVINGLFVFGPIEVTSGGSPVAAGLFADSVVVGVEAVKPDLTSRDFYLFDTLKRQITLTNAYQRTLEHLGPLTNVDSLSAYATMTGAVTMANQASYGSPGHPLWALTYWYYGTGTNPNWKGQPQQWLYPDPTINSVVPYQWTNPASGTTYPAYTIAHNNRIVLVERFPNTAFSGPGASNWTDASHILSGYEIWSYTDPPNSIALGTQQSTFVQENPSGIGAWGSISAGELFVVKNNGGGFVLSGDFIQPTITRLPGIVPSYGLVSRTALTSRGLMYASNNQGVYAWNGGNTSQCISDALDPSFTRAFLNALPTFGGSTTFLFDGPGFDICRWGDWVVCTGDYVYDMPTGSWWKLPLGTGSVVHYFYGVSSDGQTLFATPLSPTLSVMVDVYTLTTPSTTWSWTSFPIRLPELPKNRDGVIREVVVRAQGNGFVGITFTGKLGATTAGTASLVFTLTSDTSQPRMIRQNVAEVTPTAGPLIAEDIIINIAASGATGSTAAPIVYGVSIGYTEREPVNAL